MRADSVESMVVVNLREPLLRRIEVADFDSWRVLSSERTLQTCRNSWDIGRGLLIGVTGRERHTCVLIVVVEQPAPDAHVIALTQPHIDVAADVVLIGVKAACRVRLVARLR